MKKISFIIMSALLMVSLVGCGAKQNIPTFQAKYYPDCYDPIAKLCKDQDNSQEIKEAATGALLGAVGGAVVGGLIKGDWKGAAAGAAVGAAVGGMTGFFHARLSKINDRKERLAEYQKMLGENAKSWDLEKASVEKAYTCYREQINALRNAAKAKAISKEEFLARMNEIKGGIENINRYWADSQSRMDANMADGETFIKEQEAEDLKLAKAQQAQAKKDIQKIRSATTAQKRKIQNEKDEVNKLKTDLGKRVTMLNKEFVEFFDASKTAELSLRAWS